MREAPSLAASRFTLPVWGRLAGLRRPNRRAGVGYQIPSRGLYGHSQWTKFKASSFKFKLSRAAMGDSDLGLQVSFRKAARPGRDYHRSARAASGTIMMAKLEPSLTEPATERKKPESL